VREICSRGSVRGAVRKGRPYRDHGHRGKDSIHEMALHFRPTPYWAPSSDRCPSATPRRTRRVGRVRPRRAKCAESPPSPTSARTADRPPADADHYRRAGPPTEMCLERATHSRDRGDGDRFAYIDLRLFFFMRSFSVQTRLKSPPPMCLTEDASRARSCRIRRSRPPIHHSGSEERRRLRPDDRWAVG
jgi:hypothetical protein